MAVLSNNKDGMLRALRELGIEQGMTLGVHASFKSLGPVDGGAAAIIEVLLEAVGQEGTLMMPTHSAPLEIWKQSDTPSNCGYLTEYFRTYPGVKRSLHPTHACSAIGAKAEWLLAGHPTQGGEAPGCPFHRLAEAGGFIMMVGIKYNACTLLHVSEELEDVPYRKHACHESYARSHLMITADGREIPYTPVTFPGCSYNFRQVETELHKAGLIKHGKVGNAECTLAKASDILEHGRAFLRSHPGMFLCDRDTCAACKRVKGLMDMEKASK